LIFSCLSPARANRLVNRWKHAPASLSGLGKAQADTILFHRGLFVNRPYHFAAANDTAANEGQGRIGALAERSA
jgi:hypothetical protein